MALYIYYYYQGVQKKMYPELGKKKYNIKYNYKHKLISTLEEVMVAGSGSLLFFVIFFKYGEGK